MARGEYTCVIRNKRKAVTRFIAELDPNNAAERRAILSHWANRTGNGNYTLDVLDHDGAAQWGDYDSSFEPPTEPKKPSGFGCLLICALIAIALITLAAR